MLRWALGFLIVAIVAAILGFNGVASTSANVAKVLFFIFLSGFVIALFMSLAAARRLTH